MLNDREFFLTNTSELVRCVRNHNCYSHPLFYHWVDVRPSPQVIAAFFFQLKSFCAATRYGWSFPKALRSFDFSFESELLQGIVDSEVGHGLDLAKMVGFVINRAAKSTLFEELDNQQLVEAKLKCYSDALLGHLDEYDVDSGLAVETREAVSIFERRKLTDYNSTLISLGSALALELVSNNHIIPGIKHCLIDSNLYDVNMEAPEMFYIKEHWGELGAEHQHESMMLEAINSACSGNNFHYLMKGANDLLNSLLRFWRFLDKVLLIDERTVQIETPHNSVVLRQLSVANSRQTMPSLEAVGFP